MLLICDRGGAPGDGNRSAAGRTVGYRGGAMATPGTDELQAAIAGFDRLYGLELLSISDTEVTARVRVRDEIKQPAGLVHGGVYAPLGEAPAPTATHAALAPQ